MGPQTSCAISGSCCRWSRMVQSSAAATAIIHPDIQVASGSVNVLTVLPQFTTTPNGLTLNCAFTGPAGTQVNWDFGDENAARAGAAAPRTAYARPGRYEVMTRLVRAARSSSIAAPSWCRRTHSAAAPLAVTPTFSAERGRIGRDGEPRRCPRRAAHRTFPARLLRRHGARRCRTPVR